MRARRLFYRRAFLNKPRHESIGLVLGEVKVAPCEMEAKLIIGDCSRTATLDFSVWIGSGEYKKLDKAEIANVRHKATVLQSTVNAFVAAVETGLLEIEAEFTP